MAFTQRISQMLLLTLSVLLQYFLVRDTFPKLLLLCVLLNKIPWAGASSAWR